MSNLVSWVGEGIENAVYIDGVFIASYDTNQKAWEAVQTYVNDFASLSLIPKIQLALILYLGQGVVTAPQTGKVVVVEDQLKYVELFGEDHDIFSEKVCTDWYERNKKENSSVHV